MLWAELGGPAYPTQGVTYIREKRWDDALAELRKAESLAPNQSGIKLNIGLAYYRKSDFFLGHRTIRLGPAIGARFAAS